MIVGFLYVLVVVIWFVRMVVLVFGLSYWFLLLSLGIGMVVRVGVSLVGFGMSLYGSGGVG